ncbi:MAG: Crp/Fnr family transcriptional regulator [Blastocatellia bacterium]
MSENQILAALPPRERTSLLKQTERVPLNQGDVLHKPEQATRFVYFPTAGVVSMLGCIDDRSIEVGTVGNEGIAGAAVFLGINKMYNLAIVQVAGEAMRIRVKDFQKAAAQDNVLHGLLHLYTYTLLCQATYSIACNRFHDTERRLARWLLRIRDHVGAGNFYLTQEFLSKMVGTPRPHITTAAGNLQKAGLIRYYRGDIDILDGDGLEKVSCHCYRTIKDYYDHSMKR